jgi:hypothetical protein
LFKNGSERFIHVFTLLHTRTLEFEPLPTLPRREAVDVPFGFTRFSVICVQHRFYGFWLQNFFLKTCLNFAESTKIFFFFLKTGSIKWYLVCLLYPTPLSSFSFIFFLLLKDPKSLRSIRYKRSRDPRNFRSIRYKRSKEPSIDTIQRIQRPKEPSIDTLQGIHKSRILLRAPEIFRLETPKFCHSLPKYFVWKPQNSVTRSPKILSRSQS